MNDKRIFIFEFVAGGGFNKESIPASLFCEGFSMLRAIVADFKQLDFEIITLLDKRIEFLSKLLEADETGFVNLEDDYQELYVKMVNQCEYCFIIAPEFSNILYNLTKIVLEHNKILLSIGLEGIKLGTSKLATYKFFKASRLDTPRTWLIPKIGGSFDTRFILAKFKELSIPIIIKPDDGVGAESIYYFKNESEIIGFFKDSSEKLEINRKLILQEYVEGDDLSCFLIGGKNPVILSINAQDINIKGKQSESAYLGGHTPVNNIVRIKEILEKIIEKVDLSQFNGLFGIDFIYKKDNTICFIEINPRLTTPYIGIRNIVNQNLVKLLSQKLENPNLIDKIMHIGSSIFSRLDLIYEGKDSTNIVNNKVIPELLIKIPELLTPPITFELGKERVEKNFSCLLATKTVDLASSRSRIEEIVRIFQNHNFAVSK